MPSAKRILIADDDPIYRDIAAETLSKAGHVVTLAADGGEALAKLAADEFDAAIVDLTMPVADGLTVIQTLRGSTSNATIPVIVITGHDDAAAVERAYRAGATSFLTKPLNWILFTPHVEFVLRCGDTERELREANATTAFLSELKSQMMTALAQEFQSPIKTIFGFSQLIEKEVYGPIGPPAYKEMLVDIERSARSLNASLLKVMNFGRTLTGQLDIETQLLDARSIVTDAVAAFEMPAERRGITLTQKIAIPQGTRLLADPVLLNQAMRGVIDNAVRLSPRGSVVAVEATTGVDGNLVLTIHDNGPSLPEVLIDDVNGKAKTSRPAPHHQQSPDVSMRIAQILTEAHRGKLSIATGAVAGNTVRMSLPLSSENMPAAVSRNDVGSASADEPATPQPETVYARIGAELARDPRIRSRANVMTGFARANPLANRTLGEMT